MRVSILLSCFLLVRGGLRPIEMTECTGSTTHRCCGEVVWYTIHYNGKSESQFVRDLNYLSADVERDLATDTFRFFCEMIASPDGPGRAPFRDRVGPLLMRCLPGQSCERRISLGLVEGVCAPRQDVDFVAVRAKLRRAALQKLAGKIVGTGELLLEAWWYWNQRSANRQDRRTISNDELRQSRRVQSSSLRSGSPSRERTGSMSDNVSRLRSLPTLPNEIRELVTDFNQPASESGSSQQPSIRGEVQQNDIENCTGCCSCFGAGRAKACKHQTQHRCRIAPMTPTTHCMDLSRAMAVTNSALEDTIDETNY